MTVRQETNPSALGQPNTEQNRALENLKSRLRGCAILTIDWDKTITDRRPVQLPGMEGLDVSHYLDEHGEGIELENVDLIILYGLVAGQAINISTGKDANAWVWARYLQERITYLMQKLVITETFPDGRPKSLLDSMPVVFTFTIGNGGYCIDLISGEVIIHKPIPLDGWERLQEHSQLLRDSTVPARMEQIARARRPINIDGHEKVVYVGTRIMPPREPYDPENDEYIQKIQQAKDVPRTNQVHRPKMEPITQRAQLFREIEPPLSEEERRHRDMLQGDIRDFAVFVPGISTKANLVLDLKRIITDTSLNGRWLEQSGIRIIDERTLLKAVNALFEGCNVTIARSEAQGVVYIDIGAVNKEIGARLVKNYYQGLLRIYAREQQGVDDESYVLPIPKVYSLQLGDGVAPFIDKYESKNDAPMLLHTGGTTNHTGPERYTNPEGWPVYLADIYGQHERIKLTNLFLRDAIRARIPMDDVEFRQRLRELLDELRRERQQTAC